jgi:hypothetical protein
MVRACRWRKIKFNYNSQGGSVMSKYVKFAVVAAALVFGFGTAIAQEAAHVKPVTAYVLANIKPWLSDPIVVNTVNAQNVANAKLKNYEINKLDNGWIDRSDKKLIDSKMNNELSTFLRNKKEAGKGTIFEIFIFDNKGLNVGQTDLTQDFNQGDEAKYWKTYQVGPDAIFVDNVERDHDKNISQASLTIKDPATGKAIGAVTVGIDIDKLK